MEKHWSRIAVNGLAVFLAASALAPDSAVKPAYELKYRYAYRHIAANDSDTITENWNGNIEWNLHEKRDELWIGKDDKTYLITDAATLDAFRADFQPLWDFNLQRGKYMDGYYEARSEERSVSCQGRSFDRQISKLQAQRERASDESARKDIDDQISDLTKEKSDADKQAAEWSKKLDAATKKRQEFFDKKEALRAEVYRKIDQLIDEA